MDSFYNSASAKSHHPFQLRSDLHWENGTAFRVSAPLFQIHVNLCSFTVILICPITWEHWTLVLVNHYKSIFVTNTLLVQDDSTFCFYCNPLIAHLDVLSAQHCQLPHVSEWLQQVLVQLCGGLQQPSIGLVLLLIQVQQLHHALCAFVHVQQLQQQE